MTARARARPVAPRCHRAEWTGYRTTPRPSFATIVAQPSLSGSGTPHRPSPVAIFPGVIPRSPAGAGACPFSSPEYTKMFCQAAGVFFAHPSRLARRGSKGGFAASETPSYPSWLRVNPSPSFSGASRYRPWRGVAPKQPHRRRPPAPIDLRPEEGTPWGPGVRRGRRWLHGLRTMLANHLRAG